jgi:hypothetical protein
MYAHQFNDAEDMSKVIMEYVRKYKMRKIRFFQGNLSYEDFSISYMLTGKAILNFTVSNENENIVVKKKDPRATRHICFNKETLCEIEFIKKHVPYMAIRVMGDLSYTDGSRRYEEKNNVS